jgi:hypothetical protein
MWEEKTTQFNPSKFHLTGSTFMSSEIIKQRTITIPCEAEQLKFKEIFAITDQRAATKALTMAQFFHGALVEAPDNPGTLEFDVVRAKSLVDANSSYALVEFRDEKLTQQTAEVSAMVNMVVEYMHNILQVALTAAQTAAITTSITNVFTQLSPQKEDAWIFWKSEEAHKSSYQYNIMFALQNASTGLFIFGLPVGLTIEANINKQELLFITLKDKVSYEVRLQAMKVVQMI